LLLHFDIKTKLKQLKHLNHAIFLKEKFGQFLANEVSNYRPKQGKTIIDDLQRSFNQAFFKP